MFGYGIVAAWFGLLIYVAGSQLLAVTERAILGALGA